MFIKTPSEKQKYEEEKKYRKLKKTRNKAQANKTKKVFSFFLSFGKTLFGGRAEAYNFFFFLWDLGKETA